MKIVTCKRETDVFVSESITGYVLHFRKTKYSGYTSSPQKINSEGASVETNGRFEGLCNGTISESIGAEQDDYWAIADRDKKNKLNCNCSPDLFKTSCMSKHITNRVPTHCVHHFCYQQTMQPTEE